MTASGHQTGLDRTLDWSTGFISEGEDGRKMRKERKFQEQKKIFNEGKGEREFPVHWTGSQVV